MLATIVLVVNGALVPSSPPARTLFGSVVAPLTAIAARIADRVTRSDDVVTVARGTHACTFHVGVAAYDCDGVVRRAPVTPFGRDGAVFVPLAGLVRGLGGDAAFDARTQTIAVTFPPATAVVSPAPFDPTAPQASPTAVFTPQPPPATPRPVVTGDPLPRRTAIPARPSRVPAD